MAYIGLTSSEARDRLMQYGPNTIEEKKTLFIVKLFRWIVSPISLMLIAAAILSYVAGKYFDVWFIVGLMMLNLGVTFWQEHKADAAIEKLKEHLTTQVRVLRDGVWTAMPSSNIVPGDVIKLFGGNIVSADVQLQDIVHLSINDAAVTGESLPQEKKVGDTLYAGSFVVSGQAVATVTATGSHTYFGKTLLSVQKTSRRSILEQDILRISKFLSLASVVVVVLLTGLFLWYRIALVNILTLDLSLVIAGIPISLPTVMTLIISLGVLELSKKNVIVKRLSSLEDLANVQVLFSDKTGTLTKNEIHVTNIIAYGTSEESIIRAAALASIKDDESSINKAILDKARDMRIAVNEKDVISFIPADSERKRSFAVVMSEGVNEAISVGAPQIIASLCAMHADTFDTDVEHAAKQGYRSLAVAVKEGSSQEQGMRMIGILLISDILRDDAKNVVEFLRANGVDVRMVTGDHRAIGERIAQDVGIAPDKVYAEILPADKLKLVEAEKKQAVVAATGDGINDLPAIKTADVGIAVSNAVDALKSGADIVLLSSGIGVIKDAIIEARKIFARLYTYSIYRMSESFRLIVTIAVLGIIYHTYPLEPLQLILLAFLNDVPIISLAVDRVTVVSKPSTIRVADRFILSALYGLTGIANSLVLFFIIKDIVHLPWNIIETIFFLKLAISGHMLVYVAHTKERWWRFLPSKAVILATAGTQVVATLFALVGIFMPAIPVIWIVVVWVWAFGWMQISELAKMFHKKYIRPRLG